MSNTYQTPEELEGMPPVEEPRPPKSKSRKRSCPECGSVYGIPYLYQHLREQHGIYGGATGIKRLTKPAPQFDCELCPRTFDTKHGLTMHVSLKHKSEAQATAQDQTSKALVPVPVNNHHREPTFRLSKEWRIVEDDDGTPFLLLALADLVSDRMGR